MAFELEPTDAATPFILYTLHDISIGAGILAIWFGADEVVKWCMNKKWFERTTNYSFIIFALHVPLIHYTTQLAFLHWNHFRYYRLLTYAIVPVVIFFFCLITGKLLKSTLPKVYKIATGGRGF
jgi:hypothetical protein